MVAKGTGVSPAEGAGKIAGVAVADGAKAAGCLDCRPLSPDCRPPEGDVRGGSLAFANVRLSALSPLSPAPAVRELGSRVRAVEWVPVSEVQSTQHLFRHGATLGVAGRCYGDWRGYRVGVLVPVIPSLVTQNQCLASSFRLRPRADPPPFAGVRWPSPTCDFRHCRPCRPPRP